MALNKEIEQIVLKENKKRNIEFEISLKENEPIKLVIKDELTGITVEKTGAVVEKAENQRNIKRKTRRTIK